MTAKHVGRLITTWRDWIVLAGLGVNLLVVGAIYGRVDATLARTVADVDELETAVAAETEHRLAGDDSLLDEMTRRDERLEDRVLAALKPPPARKDPP